MEQLRREIDNLVEAIVGGALRASPRLAQRLAAAEAELANLQAPAPAAQSLNVEALAPRIVDRNLAAVDALPETVNRLDPDRGREQLRELIGPIEVEADEREIRFNTKEGTVEGALSRMAGGTSAYLVAGGRFWTCLLRLPQHQ